MADPYLYPGTTVLRNKLGIRDTAQLEQTERVLVTQRAAEGIPAGTFGLDHMKAIHRHLFQDLYEWAGEIRTVEIAKSGQQFQFRQFIETGMADVQARLERANFLKGLSAAEFAEQAGHPLDLMRLDPALGRRGGALFRTVRPGAVFGRLFGPDGLPSGTTFEDQTPAQGARALT